MRRIPSFVYFLVVILLGVILLVFAVSKKQDSFTQTEQKLIETASSIGLDVEQFKTDFKSEEVRNIVEDQRNDALNRLGSGASTPAVFIGQNKVDALSFQELKPTIQGFLDAREDKKTPLTIEVFSDFNCPHCAAFDPITYQLKKAFGDEINIEHKNLPFLKESSYTYAYAAEAARKQGKFDLMSVNIYEMVQGNNYDSESVKTLIEEINKENI